ncbi:hypothetical protein LOTGIDRAFT_161540 [Lottia gigantea]|uniref:WSC domain-containing protein n=1 Tax=Lottia gigantea TaxID=225164 RepID=V3ZS91_LOTGI|nr:hypothetical protein LOTGIDRAFT_161540 [Lottia gigantea]ESO94313.1 hypothetical protein LOTGIDRAFT_161540 [Lottia gigantea]
MELYKITTSILLMVVLLEFRVSAVSTNNYFRYKGLISRNPPGWMPAFDKNFKDMKLGDNCYVSSKGKRKGNKCSCDNKALKKGLPFQCKIRCKANSKQNCGGEAAFATYKTGYAYYPKKALNKAGTKYDSSRFYMGCYENPPRLGKRLDFGTLRMTVDLCCASCFDLYHHNFAAVTNGAFCTCFLKADTLKKIEDFRCQKVKCVNNVKQFCGGEYSEIRVFKKTPPSSGGAPPTTRLPPHSTYLRPFIRPKGCYDYFDGAKDKVNKDVKCNPMPLPDGQMQQAVQGKSRPMGSARGKQGPNGAGRGGAKQMDRGKLAAGNKKKDTKKKKKDSSDATLYGVSGGVLAVLLIGFCCYRNSKKAEAEKLEKEEREKEEREERKRKKKKKKEKKKKEQEEAARMGMAVNPS